MVWCCHDHCLHVLVFEQTPEIAVAFGFPARQRNPLLHARLVDIRNGHDIHIFLGHKTARMDAADEPEPYDAYPNAIIGA